MKKLGLFCLLLSIFSTPGFCQIPIDLSFDASQISNPPDFTTVRVILVQPDGKILFGGTSDYDVVPDASGPGFGRLNDDGTWDVPFQNNVGYAANTGFHGGDGHIEERSMALDGGVSVRDLLLLPDGKIIVVGDFLAYNLNKVFSIGRLNADGTLDGFGSRGGFADDEAFRTPGHGINAVVRQPDGKLIVAGDFTATGDYSLQFGYIARVDANGNIDPAFYSFGNTTDKGFNAGVNDLELQTDGKVLVAGRFSTFRSALCGPLARINSDYTLDVPFFTAQGTGFGPGELTKIAIQSDGKIIVTGTFTSFNGVPKSGILRLNPDGSLDPSFDAGTGPSATIYALAIQADGSLLVGGKFTTFNGVSRSGIVRLKDDGSVDASFNPGTGFGPRPVDANMGIYALTIQPDEKILAGGDIGSYNGTPRNSLVRVFKDDAAFPVKLIAFNVKTENRLAILNWSTSFETNSESFGIERSADGKSWTTIGKVGASGESVENKTYAFIDSIPSNGINLYRLKMTDFDKSFTYSRIQSARFENVSALAIYPNPVHDRIFVKNMSLQDVRRVTVYNNLGRELISSRSVSASGIDIRKLGAGNYVMKIELKNGTVESHTFMVQR
jgi:uncharacterized delta-60 repeat protein